MPQMLTSALAHSGTAHACMCDSAQALRANMCIRVRARLCVCVCMPACARACVPGRQTGGKTGTNHASSVWKRPFTLAG
eukprot:15442711-Alexandrium_andersonii.AAC.1